MGNGLLHIYTGDGKGKTTAATGLAVRAAGQGLKVAFFQFMKNGKSGELYSLRRLGITVVSPTGTNKFVFQMNSVETAEYSKRQENTLQQAFDFCGNHDLIVLDEVFAALSTKMITEKELMALINNRPVTTELVLTGRDAPECFVQISDYCTEMKLISHPYNKGIQARKGIEF